MTGLPSGSLVSVPGRELSDIEVWALLKFGRSLRAMLTADQRTFDVADVAHILYRLADFDEVDHQAMPRMCWKTSWKRMKDDLSRMLKNLRT